MLSVMENLIVFVINLLVFIIIIDAVLSFLPEMRTKKFALLIEKISDLFTNPIRKLIPVNKLGLDIAPLLAILILKIVQGVLLWLVNMLVNMLL